MKNDVNAMVIRVNKRRVYSKRLSDPFRHEYSSSDIIEPPYSFYDLVTFVEMSSILPQAIDAMCQNCEGYGYNLLEAKMTKEERDQYAEAIVAERDEINAFFDYCNYDMSFTALRKKLRSDYETLGNAFFEVLRNKSGRIDGFEYLKGITMRLAGLSKPVLSEVKRIKPDAWEYEKSMRYKRFRTYLQIIGEDKVYFKEFGDQRVMNAYTGEIVSDAKASEMRERNVPFKPATEVIHLRRESSRSPYGIPRWISQVPSIAGSRAAEEVNLSHFDNKTVPPMVILVSGGKLNPATVERIKEHIHNEQMDRGIAHDGDRCIIGLDVGSTTTKAILLRTDDDKMLASIYLRTNGNPVQASRECYDALLKQVGTAKVNIVGLGTTGSGRQIAGLHALTDGIINEIVAHATAATHFDSEVDTIFEIGGQDAKYTYIVNKVPADYAMNEACSAGTGSFLEESAYESLRIEVKEIADIAMKGKRPPNFNDQCAAFISSDIKTAFQEDISREDVVAGLVYSICTNYVNRVKGTRTVGKKIFMQGGVCYNKAVPIAMAALTGKHIIVPPDPGLMGAYGVALEIKEKISLGFLEEKQFDLAELAAREVTYKKPFICMGGTEHCDRKCSINMIEVMGKTFPFGGACNKYYNELLKVKYENEKYDFVKKRDYLTFVKHAVAPTGLPKDAKTVGINRSFHTSTLYPLYYNFFTQLGYNVIVSSEAKDEGIERELTSFCYPAQLSLGLFQDLIDKKPDYIFLPNNVEMYVNKADHNRVDYNATCIFVQGEPYYLKQSYKNDYDFNKVISPTFNFSYGYETQEKPFAEAAHALNVTDEEKIHAAYNFAVAKQKEYMQEMNAIAKKFMEDLEKNPQDFAIVLFGRPYNSFIDVANKGIPQKFASRGVYVIPYDMFDYHNEEVNPDMYFEVGKKILKGSKIVKRHPQLFGTYITNFSCAPDSFIVTYFRDIMGRDKRMVFASRS